MLCWWKNEASSASLAFLINLRPNASQTGERIVSAATKPLKAAFPDSSVAYEIDIASDQFAACDGAGIVIIATTTTGCILGGSALMDRGKTGDEVGAAAAAELLTALAHGGCVDEYSQDQLIILMALAKGKSRVRSGPLSLHTKTAIYFAQKLTKVR